MSDRLRSRVRAGLRGTTAVQVLLIAALVMGVMQSFAQETFWQEMTTAERIAKSKWWPTKPSTPNQGYVGNSACAECHAELVKAQAESEMARTLLAANNSSIARYVGKTSSLDGFVYRFVRTGNGLSFHVGEARDSEREPLEWAFGSGEISQVYLTAHGKNYNESHFSYFKKIDGLDVTPAQPKIRELVGAGSAADEAENKSAVGRQVSNEEAIRCFSCHAANVPAKGDLSGILPGITCEACHGPGANHVSAEKAGLASGAGLIFNSGHLSAVDRVDFCGSCHGTSLDILTEGSSGLASVRFPAYRLQNSKCWSNDDRIQCTACHDPHRAIENNTAAYDARCLSCHILKTAKPDATQTAKACPAADKDCVTCHMPKYDFPEVHHEFTDHQIRVVRAGEPVPS